MKQLTRRDFIKHSAIAATSIAAGFASVPAFSRSNKLSVSNNKKVIVIGFDGMDPGLCESMMRQGRLPNLAGLRRAGGYSVLGTSTPPQSPVAWASFINGAGPGSHGIFDFIHRDPERQVYPFFSVAETVSGQGHLEFKDHRIPLEFWPFNHSPSGTILRRQGAPFWEYLDRAGIASTFYDLPSNYPPSPSKYGNHRCMSGMGTPDLMGSYGTYQYFTGDGPEQAEYGDGEIWSKITLRDETSEPLRLKGPVNTMLREPENTFIEFIIHRDKNADAVIIEIQGHTLILKKGQWSRWISIDFNMSTPFFLPDKKLKGICRFYAQEVSPVLRLYITPINVNPEDPLIRITEPPGFSRDIAEKLGLFYTTGFREEHKALSNGVFNDDEFVSQAEYVLQERLNLLEYALDDFDDGLLFFYFSSTDLQAHMLWWDSDASHPTRTRNEAERYFNHLKEVYVRMDRIAGDLLKRYGDQAHIIIMSDHGFSNFKRQFNLNTWLCQYGYLEPYDCRSILEDADWSKSVAYGLGINSLYLNLKGREQYGIVEPGQEKDQLLDELVSKLESIRDFDGRQVIRKVHRTDRIYSGPALKYAPDLIIGYSRDFRASWDTCLGGLSEGFLMDNESAWSADHCMDASEVPGVLFSNRPVANNRPSLVDLAPSVLTEFGLNTPSTMTGQDIFRTL